VIVDGREQGLDPDFARAWLREGAVAECEYFGRLTEGGVDGAAQVCLLLLEEWP